MHARVGTCMCGRGYACVGACMCGRVRVWACVCARARACVCVCVCVGGFGLSSSFVMRENREQMGTGCNTSARQCPGAYFIVSSANWRLDPMPLRFMYLL